MEGVGEVGEEGRELELSRLREGVEEWSEWVSEGDGDNARGGEDCIGIGSFNCSAFD